MFCFFFADDVVIPPSFLDITLSLIITILLAIAGLVLIFAGSYIDRMFQRYRILGALCLVAFFCFVMIFLGETILWLKQKPPGSEVNSEIINFKFRSSISVRDRELGYKSPPWAKVHAISMVNNHTNYGVFYRHDELGRRITPVEPGKKYQDFCLFFGDSLTYGIGVNDKETIPAVFARRANTARVYNYGYIDYGLQSMLTFLERKQFAAEIPESAEILSEKGLHCLVLTYIDDQLLRAIGSMSEMRFGESFPYYSLSESEGSRQGDKIRRIGNFDSERTFTTLVYKILGYSRILRSFDFNLPLKIQDDHVQLAAALIKKSKELFLQKFKSKNFWVVYYLWGADEGADRITPLLRGSGVNVLDLRPMARNLDRSKLEIDGDGHPNARANEIIGNLIADKLLNRDTPLAP